MELNYLTPFSPVFTPESPRQGIPVAIQTLRGRQNVAEEERQKAKLSRAGKQQALSSDAHRGPSPAILSALVLAGGQAHSWLLDCTSGLWEGDGAQNLMRKLDVPLSPRTWDT